MGRAKKARTKAAESPSPKKARGAKSSAADKAAEGPFFRPFRELAIAKKAESKAQERGASKGDPKTTPKGAAATSNVSGGSSRTSRVGPPSSPRGAKAAAPSEAAEAAEAAEAETFALYMAGVRTLDNQRKTRIPRTASEIEKPAEGKKPATDLDAPARAQMRSLVTEGLRFESSDDGERLEGRRVDVDPRELRRLRRGQYAVDGRLDLHGMSLPEAREAVTSFVRKRGSEGDRVVAIIHGKGTHSPRGVAILRGEIGAWLSDGRAARHVMAFATAPDEHGGTGALLVLLAR